MPTAEKALAPEQLRDRILHFISRGSLSRPVLKEEGTEPIALEPGNFSVATQHGKLLLEAWDERRSVVRRIVGLKRESATEMVLVYRRFGSGDGTVRLLASSKSTEDLQRDAGRAHFAGRLRKLLAQLFPEWKLDSLSSERDLTRSFSVHVTRARLRRGNECWAVAGCAESEGEVAAASALTQGLAWLDHLRHPPARASGSRKPPVVCGVKLFLPERFAAATVHRVPFLNPDLARFEVFVFDAEDQARLAAEAEYPNLATEIPAGQAPANAGTQHFGGKDRKSFATESQRFTEVHRDSSLDLCDSLRLCGEKPSRPGLEMLRRLAARPDVDLRYRYDSGWTCSIRGLVFARATRDGAWFGSGDDWQPLTPASLGDAVQLAAQVARLRRGDSPDPHHPFYTAQAERWLESMLIADIAQLGSELDPRFVYSQVPAIGGRERGIIDLLAVTRQGRLAVIELKASADLNLPLQALDYWMRVKWHLDRGEFARLGYFPGIGISQEAPLLWLVTPAFDFHPLNEVVLRYLSPAIPVRCVGINQEWRKGLQIVTRR